MTKQLVIRSVAVIGVMTALIQPSFAGTGTSGRGATCTAGHQDAAPIEMSQPEMPWLAKLMRLSGSVKVRIDLDDAGTLQSVSIAESSGNAILDREALKAVRESTFSPEKVDCVGMAGSYAVEVSFAP
jgi:TonB family protein